MTTTATTKAPPTGVEFIATVGAILGIVFGGIGAVLVYLLAGTFVDGYVVVWLWRWFALPLGAPPIGYWLAVGVMLLVRYVRPASDETERDGQGKEINVATRWVVRLVFVPPIWLGVGAFVHAMMFRS